MTKRDGSASDHLRTQAAATPQDELVAGLSGAPESIRNPALLAQVLDRANLQRALKQVRQNKGAPGIDGMSVDALPEHLRHHWLEIRAQLEAGSYRPQPVRRVEIPKAGGKTRPLGIPTVLDRFIQQAIAQVICAQWEPHFHPHSYGFRPQRSAHQAVREVQANIRAGYGWVVDMDLQAFFDRVNHDRLMARLKSRCPDADLLRLVNRFLKAGVSVGGKLEPTSMGVPQGGPLSPVLANVVLDELDWELDSARPPLCPLCRRLQHPRQKQTCRRAGDGQRDTLCQRLTAAHSESAEERGGSTQEPQVPGFHGQPQRRQAQGGRSRPSTSSRTACGN
jgi:RNA-directed DNA polymerase